MLLLANDTILGQFSCSRLPTAAKGWDACGTLTITHDITRDTKASTFSEVEQAASSPSNTVRGISYSPDKMLQARVLSYADAMQGGPDFIIERQLGQLEKVHPDYAAGVRAALAQKKA